MAETAATTRPVDLVIGGMTCASCAARIERRLNKLDGVTATVNYATEHAKVEAPADVDLAELIAQVEAAGYSARDARPAPGTSAVPPADVTPPASYEAGLQELERLVNELESGQLPLDRLLVSYQRGAFLLSHCRDRLQAVEDQIKVLDAGTLKPWSAE